MKKRILILLAVLAALVCLCTVSASAAENTIVKYCEFCDLTETWYPLTNTTALETKHYYLTKNSTFAEKIITDGMTVCLELNGYTYTGNRRIILESGATLNVQGKDGTLRCRGKELNTTTNAYEPGGCVWVKAGAELNLYSGTLAYQDASSSMDRGVSRGGVVAVYGEFNMYGGTLKDGVAKELGGTMFVDGAGKFNMYGGKVLTGTAPNSPCVYARGKVLVVSDASVEHIQLTPHPNAGSNRADQLTIREKYTGTLCLSIYGVTTAGVDVGNSENADISGASIYMEDNDLKLKVSGTDLVTYLPEPAKITSGTTETAYSTLEEAMENLQDGDILTLQRRVEGNLTIDENITLDLNGTEITGTLTAAAGKTLFVRDSFTADYSVSDGVYGKVAAISGDVKAAPATETEDPYLMITEDSGISFHAVGLNINGMTLKPGDAALYFNNNFAGDEKVTDLVDSFGVAMSVDGAPTLETMNNSKHYTQLDKALFGTKEGNNGSLLYGIMKAENGVTANNKNAATGVFGRAYIKLTDGSYLFGTTRSRSLKAQVELAGEKMDSLTAEEQDGLYKFVEKFTKDVKDWSLDKIYDYIENHEKETLKIMIVGNSHSVDAFWLMYKAFQDQYPDQKLMLGIMYYSGCPITKHVTFDNNNSPVYDYRYNRDGNWIVRDESTLRDGLTDQQWDIVVMQVGTGDMDDPTVSKTARDRLKEIIDECVPTEHEIYWHTTWPSPNDETFYSATYDPQPPTNWKDNLIEKYGFDPVAQMQSNSARLQETVLVDPMYAEYVNCFPAIMYALNKMGCSQLDLWRDYTHLSDLGRLIAAYCWVTQVNGEPLTEINIDTVEKILRHRRAQAYGDMTVTEEMKEIIIESVNYALENRWEVPTAEVTE